MSFRRMAGYAGILFVVLLVASFFTYGTPPGPTDPVSDIAKYVADTGGFLVGGVLGALGAALFLVFAVGFALPFLKSDREHAEGYGVVIVATGAVAIASFGVAVMALGTLGLRIDEFDGPSVRALWDLSNVAYSFSILMLIPFGGAAAAGIMKHGMMPRWFGTFSAVLALAGLTGIAGLASSGNLANITLVGFGMMLLWSLVAGFLMARDHSAT